MSTTRANLLMLIPPLIWGVAFVYQKTGMGSIGPFTFSFARFFFALLTVLPLAILFEKHNFLSNFKDPKFSIHFPKKFIFPTKKDKYYKIVSLPKKPEMMCHFLYGVEWKTPLKKNISYRMEIVDNKPLLIKRSFLGSLTRWFKTKLSIN